MYEKNSKKLNEQIFKFSNIKILKSNMIFYKNKQIKI